MNRILNYKSILQMIKKSVWFLLICFAFSSCAVKKSLFQSIGLSLEMSNGQSKTVSTCQTNFIVSDKKETQEIVSKKSLLLFKSVNNLSDFPKCEFTWNKVSTLNNSNSPPKYILYQRLKIAIV